jgi:two-component system, NtrC family, nitrogen regulation response regulator GlnG
MPRSTILVIDDEPNILKTVRLSLEIEGYTVEVGGSGAVGLQKLGERDVDLVLLDVMMPGEGGLEVLPKIRAAHPDVMVIMMSGNATVETAVQATKLGAHDFVEKPLTGEKLLLTVQNALEFGRLSRENARLRARADAEHSMIGRSPGMKAILDKVAKTAPSSGRVLITGENGTGKELVARAVHDRSRRAKGAFVKVNCAAIPSELIESELFGHEKGAFTGATTRNAGRFEQAEGGTLFLDEIGDMPLEAQTRLLRVLQQGEYTTVGGRNAIKANVRIVAATHRDLKGHIQQGLFREDLFYRLNVVPIRLPPLRERGEDVPALVRHFLAQAAAEGLPTKSLDQAAMDRLKAHRWPGNVRELENLVRRLAALYSQDVIGVDLINAELADVAPVVPPGDQTPRAEGLSAAVERHIRGYFEAHKGGLPPPGLYDRVLQEVERPLIGLSLNATRGNQIKAAHLLGLNRNTLRKKIRELDIQVIRGAKS